MRKTILISTLSLLTVLSSANKQSLENIATLVSDNALSYVDVRHYAGTVYTQSLVELYRATGSLTFKNSALDILSGFTDGRYLGYGSFRSYKVGGTAAPEMVFIGENMPREQALVGAKDMFANQCRNRDGVMLPPWKGAEQKNGLFADCVFAVTPYMLYSGLISDNNEWIDYSAWMCLKTFNDLRDPQTGLIHQARAVRWLEEDQFTDDCWSRGNGWGAMALAALMRDLPRDNAYYDQVCDLARDYFAAVLKYSDESGLWHQEMTWPDSYVEISGSALLLYGLGTGISRGILPSSYRPAFEKGLASMLRYIDKDGNVGNTCSGCLAYGDGSKSAYASHKYYCNEQHAFGPVLLALAQGLAMGVKEVDAELGVGIEGFTPRCTVRCVEQRKKDIAWENDRAAFRVYSQLSPKDKISSGVDFWAKSVDYPIVDRWYAKDLNGGSYHIDEGEGCDFYAVGKNRGMGGIGIWNGKELFAPEPYSDYTILRDTPQLLEFSLKYPPFDVDGDKVRITHVISMLKGSYFYRSTVTVRTESGKPVVLAAGLTNFGSADVFRDASRACLSLEEDFSDKYGRIGGTIVANPDLFSGFATADKDELVLMKAGSGRKVGFYVAAGWSGDQRFDPFSVRWPRIMRETNWNRLEKNDKVPYPEPALKTTYPLFENALANVKPDDIAPDKSWFPYPAYSDRSAWKKIAREWGKSIISKAEKEINHRWTPLPPSKYLEYEKTGNRAIFKPIENHRTALMNLALAELLEGKGRFTNAIIDGLWYFSQEVSWSHPQHTAYQSSRRTLPVKDERSITYHSSAVGAELAVILHFFQDELDKVDPSIAKAVKRALRVNIIDPFLDEEALHTTNWRGFASTPTIINNHTTNENFNCLLVILLSEDNREDMLRALSLALRTEDKYLSYIRHDGACEEGNDYYNAAFGKLYEFSKLLYDATGGKLDVMKDSLLRSMASFRAYSYIGDGYSMNYADGPSRGSQKAALMYRFGKDTGSTEAVNYSLLLCCENADRFSDKPTPTSMYQAIEAFRFLPEMRQDEKRALEAANGDWSVMRANLRQLGSVWYPQTEYAILRNGNGWFLAAKGGHNNESHNHNDNGSGMVFYNSIPLIVDPGAGTYTKDTFSSNRYNLWMNRSDWHNLPEINGVLQHNGAEFKTSGSLADIAKNTFVTEIQGCYPEAAQCIKWLRTWTLGKNEVTIVDSFKLSNRIAADIEHFIVHGQVYLPGAIIDGYKVKPSQVVIAAEGSSPEKTVKVLLTYPRTLFPSVEVMKMPDDKFKRSWGERLVRLNFKSADNAPLESMYSFRISLF